VATIAPLLIAASAGIVFVLGVLHLVFTYRGERFFPRDASLLPRMQAVSPKITRQTSIWNAGIGFHASHSLGAMLFGLVYGYLATAGRSFLFDSPFLLGLGLMYQLAMAVLAKRQWFTVPFRGIGLAAVLYAGGLAAIAV
jgi:hypothetical protein